MSKRGTRKVLGLESTEQPTWNGRPSPSADGRADARSSQDRQVNTRLVNSIALEADAARVMGNLAAPGVNPRIKPMAKYTVSNLRWAL